MNFSVRLSLGGAALGFLVTLATPSAAAQAGAISKQSSASSSTGAASAAKKPAASTTSATKTAPAATRARTSATRSTDPVPPLWKRDENGNLVPDVRAAAAIIYDPTSGRVLWEEHSKDERSIASLTKLMTAVTFVSTDPDLSQKVTVTRADLRNASTTYLEVGDVLTYADLLHLALIPSDNGAARVLARTSPGGTEVFVTHMNQMAARLGLSNTHYTDPSGLDPNDVSCALDLAHVIAYASQDARLGPIMRTAEYDVHTPRRSFTVHSTNKLLGTDVDVLGGKTGFISKAGYCLATLLQIPQGQQVAVVVLGAANSTIRFWEARHLFNWVVGRAQGLVGGSQPDKH